MVNRADDCVRVEMVGSVVVANINRPNQLNAANLAVYHGLEDVLSLDAEAVVISGDHGVFSAGDDIAMFDFDDVDSADEFIVTVQQIFSLIEAHEKPVVAAVDGYALGFGFELALSCDLVVATEDARFGLPEINLGAVPPNALGRGPDVLGRGLIRYLALDGRRWLSGREAWENGWVMELHSSATLATAAVDLARAAARNQRSTHAKRLCSLDAEQAYRSGALMMPPLMASREVKERRTEFFGD